MLSLLLPADLEPGDTWRIEGLTFGRDPYRATSLDGQHHYEAEVRFDGTLDVDDEPITVRRVNLVSSTGATSAWWLNEGVGLLRAYVHDGERFQVSQVQGL